MDDVNKRLKAEIDYLSRLINTHKKQEIVRHPSASFSYQFPKAKNFRRNAVVSNIPYNNNRSQTKTFSRTNLTKLVKNQSARISPYKIDRTMKNDRSQCMKTELVMVPKLNCNKSLDKLVSARKVQNSMALCQNALPMKLVTLKSSENSVSKSIFETVPKNSSVAVTVGENKNSSIEIVANKWTPNILAPAKSISKPLQATEKAMSLGCSSSSSKFVYINKALPSRLVKTPKSSLVVKTKYKVINSGKHLKFTNSTCFRPNQMIKRDYFQSKKSYPSSHWKTSTRNQWNVSRKQTMCHKHYQSYNWKNSYFGHYHATVLKKRAIQRKRWKIHCTASHRKLSLGSHKIAKCTNLQSRMVTIGGLLYRASKMKLSRASKSSGKRSAQNRMKLQTLLIRGIRYQMDPSRKTLKRVLNQPAKKGSSACTVKQDLKRIDLGGSTYIQTQPGILTKTESAQARTFVSRVVNRSIHRVLAATEKKSRSKNNMYCMFYNRFGRCNKGNQCPYKHDPEKIAVCMRFLRGTCKGVECPFSHKVAPEKMPVCSFYLQGRCNNDSCPYRHVKVSRSAEVCKDFLRGYCPAGEKCKKRHILVCQEFTKKGSCKNGNKCPLHHPPLKGQKRKLSKSNTSVSNLAAEKTSIQEYNQLSSKLPYNDVESARSCSPLPSYIALENYDKETCLPAEPPSTVKGEPLRIRPWFLSKGTQGVTAPSVLGK